MCTPLSFTQNQIPRPGQHTYVLAHIVFIGYAVLGVFPKLYFSIYLNQGVDTFGRRADIENQSAMTPVVHSVLIAMAK